MHPYDSGSFLKNLKKNCVKMNEVDMNSIQRAFEDIHINKNKNIFI